MTCAPWGPTDLDHYYDFEAECLLQTEPDEDRDDDAPGHAGTHH